MTLRALFAAAMLSITVAHAADLSALHADLFPRFLAAMKARPTGDYRNDFYPTEAAIFFLSGYMLTGDEACRKAAEREFDISHGMVNRDGIFDCTKSGQFDRLTRDSIARHIYNFYVGYRVLGDHRMLVHADRCADAMMQYLKREPFTFRGKTYTLFDTTFEPRKPYKPLSPAWIDANQNAEIGLLYTLLYNEKASRWYHDETVKVIALDELQASFALQNMQTGEIAIGSSDTWIDKYDTTYGGYTLFSWTWANRFWQDPEWSIHIRRACDWLDPFFDGDTKAVHYYPQPSEGRMNAENAWQVFAGFADNGRDLKRLLNLYQADAAARTKGWPSWLACQAYLYAMNLPPDLLKLAGLSPKWCAAPPAPPS